MDQAQNAALVADLLNRINRMVRELQFSEGLNPAQWEALRYIARANQYSLTPGALAEYLGATRGTVSQTLISLENKGLVTRGRCTRDRRVMRLSLTGKGERLLARDPFAEIQRAACNLDPQETRQTIDGLTKLLSRICEDRGLCGFGVCETCHMVRFDGDCADGRGARCGMTGDNLAPSELSKICVDHLPANNC
jgi:DNA-binding MarR family transcriptional regulator